MIKVTSVITFICYLFQFVVSQTEIRFAFTFWRHGARVPDRGVTFDQEKGEYVDFLGEKWTIPGGELLPVGMRMHYLLGSANRNRWVTNEGFLSASYNSKELYVQSTEYNRTMMSALSNLQGLYPYGSGPELNVAQANKAFPPLDTFDFTSYFKDANLLKTSDLLGNPTSYHALPRGIQVIPVHVFRQDGEMFFFHNPAMCPPFADSLKVNGSSEKNNDIAKAINTAWGLKLRTALDIKDENFFHSFTNMYLACDTFVSGHTDGRTFAKLTAPVKDGFSSEDLTAFLDKAEKFEFNNIFDYYNGDNNGDDEKIVPRLIMTPFFNDALRWMETRISYDKDNKGYTGYAAPKVVIYSTHDMNLGAAQITLNKAFSLNKPRLTTKFASSFIFELRRPKNKQSAYTEADYTVDILYNHKNYHSVAYTTFKTNLETVILSPVYLSQYCGWNKSNTAIIDPLLVKDPVPTSYIDATIVLSCLLFVAVIAIIVLIILLARKPKSYAVSHTDKVMPTV